MEIAACTATDRTDPLQAASTNESNGPVLYSDAIIEQDYNRPDSESISVDVGQGNGILTCDEATQSDMTADMIQSLQDHLRRTNSELYQLRDEMEKLRSHEFTEEALAEKDDTVRFYTGLPNFTTLLALYHLLLPDIPNRLIIRQFQQVFLTLMRLRLGLPFEDMAH